MWKSGDAGWGIGHEVLVGEEKTYLISYPSIFLCSPQTKSTGFVYENFITLEALECFKLKGGYYIWRIW